MDASIVALEHVFLWSSSVFIAIQTFHIAALLGVIYLIFVLSVATGVVRLRPARGDAMVFTSPLALFNAFFYFTILLSKLAYAQSLTTDAIGTQAKTTLPTAGTATVARSGTQTSTFRPIFTVPAAADVGAVLLPNIKDPQAVNAQTVCPGYKGSNVRRTSNGLTATLKLAGPACNVYGTDVEQLKLTVEYQSSDRLSVNILPAHLDAKTSKQYIIPDSIIKKPGVDHDAKSSSLTNDLAFFWSNEPTFSFTIVRLSTGDVVFSTMGTKIVFENQFVEFVSTLPPNYNIYGLGETFRALRMGNNYTQVNHISPPSTSVAYEPSRLYSHPTLVTSRTAIFMGVSPSTWRHDTTRRTKAAAT